MCKFCDTMEQSNRALQSHNTSCQNSKYPKLKQELKSALLVKSWRADEPKRNATYNTFTHGGRGYQLNFCPECGRKIKGE